MKFLSKISKAIGVDDDEDLDGEGLEQEDDGDPIPTGSGEDTGGGKGLLGKLFGRSKGEDDEETDADDDEEIDAGDDEEIDAGDDRDDFPAVDDEPPIQRVRIEGVADVRPVGDFGATMGSVGGQGGDSPESRAAGPSGGAPPAAAPAVENDQPPPDDSAESEAPGETAPGEKEASSDEPGDGLDFDLTDIFEEVVEVDERLKDLADSQDDVPAEVLANELREFLAELEALFFVRPS